MKSTFLIPSIDRLFRENTEKNWFVKISKDIRDSLGTEAENPFWGFAKDNTFTQALAVSRDRYIYMNVSDIEITREMLMLLAFANPNQATQLFGARIYVEVDEITTIGPSSSGKYIKALHPSGRERMTWEALHSAFEEYTLANLILESDLAEFRTANGYVIEEEI